MKHRSYCRLVMVIMAVVLIATAIISKYSDRIFAQDSEAVMKDELHAGYGPALFEPCYTRTDSVCNYTTGLLETDAEQGILLSGPNITLDAGEYELVCTYEVFNQDELVENDIYVWINIRGTHEIEMNDTEENQIMWDGQTLIQNSGKIYLSFRLTERTENIKWTLNYQNGIEMGIKSLILKEQQ